MTDILRIKRRITGSPGAPSGLANAEIAYNEVDHILYYGEGTGGAGGSATTVVPIGGSGAFTTEAPQDSQYYSRRNAAWAVTPGGLIDAPSDTFAYGRLNTAWSRVLPLAGGALTGPLTIAGTLSNAGAFTAGTARGATAFFVDARGNAGIGVAPPAAQAVATTVDGGWLFMWGTTMNNWMQNLYYDGTNFRYRKASQQGWNIQAAGGSALWQTAPATGAADGVATMTTRMTLTDTGSLAVGIALPPGAAAAWINTNGVTATNLCANLYHDGTNWRYQVNGGGGGIISTGATGLTIYPVGTGTAGAVATISPAITIDGSGNISGPANITGAYVRSTTGVMADNGKFYVANNFSYYVGRDGSDGAWRFVENGTINFTLNTAGTLTTRGAVYCTAVVASSNVQAITLYANGTNMVFGPGGSGLIMQFQSGWYWDWNNQTGTLIWTSAAQGPQWVIHANGSCYNNVTWTGGRGPYVDVNSTRTLKREVVDVSYGLNDVLRMRPVSFRRLRDDDPVELGFIAEEMIEVVPECIVSNYLVDRDGQQETEPTLGIAAMQLIPVLVSAIKTLTARLATLEARA